MASGFASFWPVEVIMCDADDGDAHLVGRVDGVLDAEEGGIVDPADVLVEAQPVDVGPAEPEGLAAELEGDAVAGDESVFWVVHSAPGAADAASAWCRSAGCERSRADARGDRGARSSAGSSGCVRDGWSWLVDAGGGRCRHGCSGSFGCAVNRAPQSGGLV